MAVSNRLRPVLLVALLVAAASPALAADPAKPAGSPEITSRLFLSFAQDASLVKSQWWEGQIEYADGQNTDPDVFIFRGVVAFHPVKQLEVGGSVGFGEANAPAGVSDGSGATDLNAYGKWVWPNVGTNLDLSAGAMITVPTGDDTAGLGYNAFSTELFGSMRYRMQSFILGAHAGVRFNGDGDFQGVPLSGKTSFDLAISAMFPLANQVTLIAESEIETERFDISVPGTPVNIDTSAQILGGVDWAAFGRGHLRGALGAGLTDGAPNFRLILGYAYTF